jgi:hypothetical protein
VQRILMGCALPEGFLGREVPHAADASFTVLMIPLDGLLAGDVLRLCAGG